MLEQGIKEIILGDSTIVAIIGSRFRPLSAAQGEKRPFLTYEVNNAAKDKHFGGNSAYAKATVEIGIYSNTYEGLINLAKEIRRVLDGIAVTTSSVRIAPSRLEDESDTEQVVEPGTESNVYLRTQSYKVNYRDIS